MPHYAVTIVEFEDADTPEQARAAVMERLTELWRLIRMQPSS